MKEKLHLERLTSIRRAGDVMLKTLNQLFDPQLHKYIYLQNILKNELDLDLGLTLARSLSLFTVTRDRKSRFGQLGGAEQRPLWLLCRL